MNVASFLAMGGYGYYVWGSYLACAVLIAIEIVSVRVRLVTARRGANSAARDRKAGT